MSFDAHTNFAVSTVATAPSPATSGTSLVVAAGDGSKFPTAPFNATVWPANTQPTSSNAEIVRVTARSTDTLTITRAQESTSARSIGIGDQIAATITAKTLTDVETATGLALHTVSSSGSSLAVNYSTASTWDITLTANCTFTLSGFTSGDPDFLTLVLRQDATGSRTVTWPTITWIGSGVAPTLQTAASSIDTVVLFSFNGGTNVYGIAQSSASGLSEGASFPASPTDRQIFYRSDRDILYFYDLANTRWLSVTEHVMALPVFTTSGFTSTVNAARLPVPYKGVYSILVTKVATFTNVLTTNTGTKYWTIKLNQADSSDTDTQIGTTMDTSADSVGVNTAHSISPNTTVAGTSLELKLRIDTVSTPGPIFLAGVMHFRLVG